MTLKPINTLAKSYLILGSNSVDKRENLEHAVLLISQKLGRITQLSSLYISAAWGYDSPNNYLNQVVVLETNAFANSILKETQDIEKELGRTTKSIDGNYQDRPIDIDILFYDKDIIKQEKLEIPHPRISARRFVLEPLNEIAPKFKHPILQKTIQELLLECKDMLMVKKYNIS